jgi:TRAP-type C4-dicarboxylate transport system permease small subunit
MFIEMAKHSAENLTFYSHIIMLIMLILRYFLRFSFSDGYEQVDELWVFR